jgi:hypothetical protein
MTGIYDDSITEIAVYSKAIARVTAGGAALRIRAAGINTINSGASIASIRKRCQGA